MVAKMHMKLLKSTIFSYSLMLKKIFKSSSCVILTITLIHSIILAGWTPSHAATPGFTPPEDYRKDDSLGASFEPSERNNDETNPKNEMNMKDIFGSEQIFPFEMGLGN